LIEAQRQYANSGYGVDALLYIVKFVSLVVRLSMHCKNSTAGAFCLGENTWDHRMILDLLIPDYVPARLIALVAALLEQSYS